VNSGSAIIGAGSFVHSKIKMSQLCALVVLKDNNILGSINRSIASRSKDIITAFLLLDHI